MALNSLFFKIKMKHSFCKYLAPHHPGIFSFLCFPFVFLSVFRLSADYQVAESNNIPYSDVHLYVLEYSISVCSFHFHQCASIHQCQNLTKFYKFLQHYQKSQNLKHSQTFKNVLKHSLNQILLIIIGNFSVKFIVKLQS